MKNFKKLVTGPITYHIDKDAKIVVAVMHNTENIALDYILDSDLGQIKEGVVIVPYPYGFEPGYINMRSSYSARVRCHPDDKFDIETGKKLAREKLFKNIHKAFKRRVERYAKHLKVYQEHLEEDIRKFENI